MPITEIKANLTHLPTFFLFSNTKAAHFAPYPKLCRQSRNFQSERELYKIPQCRAFPPSLELCAFDLPWLAKRTTTYFASLSQISYISSCTLFPLALVPLVFSYYDTQHEVSVRPIYYFAASTLLFPPWISLPLMPAPWWIWIPSFFVGSAFGFLGMHFVRTPSSSSSASCNCELLWKDSHKKRLNITIKVLNKLEIVTIKTQSNRKSMKLYKERRI